VVKVSEEISKEMKTEKDAFIFYCQEVFKPFQFQIDRLSVGKHFSNLARFRRILMYVSRLIHKGISKAQQYDKANVYLIRLSQRDSFSRELEILKSKKKLPNTHKLSKLNPFIDPDGVMRSNSRLAHLDFLPEEMKYPIILLGANKITQAFVLETHWDKKHVVSEALVKSSLHSKFIILGITKLLKRINSNCVECRKRKVVPSEQLMGGLKIRHFPQRAFAETGIDFAGPFETTQGRGKVRRTRFVLVLTCLQTRAVHFEPTYDQTTESVINALSRFCSVRGRPVIIVSDNQTSFHKANKVLKAYRDMFYENQKSIQSGLDQNQPPIEWEFIPPRAPHVGGSWEIMVKAMKRAISAIGQNQTMDDDTFVTFLCRAMDLINQRPLLKHYSSNTAHILTPNTFD